MKSRRFITLSSSYFFYFSVLGLVVPFLAVFLNGKHFSSVEIGEIVGMFLVTKVIGPSLWAYLADKTGQQLTLIRCGSFLSLFFFCFLFVVNSYWSIAFVLAIFSLFWTAILPQLEVMTFNTIKQQPKVYARIRLWGSIGFIVIAVVGAEILERYTSHAFVWIGTVILTGLFLSTLVNKQPRIKQNQRLITTGIIDKIRDKGFLIFFIAGVLLQISFGPYYTFFALYLSEFTYSGLSVGLLIALGVVAEIVVFIYAGYLFKRFTINGILVFSLILTALRWAMIGHFPEDLLLLVLAQLMHAASFGLYHSASMLYLNQHFEHNQQNRGQAIYIGGVYGLGGAIGAYLSGLLWLEGSGAQDAFLVAAGLSLVAGLLVIKLPSTNR